MPIASNGILILVNVSIDGSHLLNRQPGKALPFYLQLRRPGVFDLIRENNLFSTVQDQVLLLIEFEEAIEEGTEKDVRRREKDGSWVEVDGERHSEEKLTGTEEVDEEEEEGRHGKAIELLIEHTSSIPVRGSFLQSILVFYVDD